MWSKIIAGTMDAEVERVMSASAPADHHAANGVNGANGARADIPGTDTADRHAIN
jgi:hypothetical protein